MAQPLRKPELDTRPYAERIRELVEQDRIGAARKLVAEALENGEHDEELLQWQRVLAPARFLGFSDELDPDRTPEMNWVTAHREEYRGQWVAVAEDRLVAHSEDIQEVYSAAKAVKLNRRPLLLYIE
jgi:uncharacterized protein DUF5678